MLIVAGDYSLSMYEGTEQFNIPQLLIPHPDYIGENNNDIMLIKVHEVPRNRDDAEYVRQNKCVVVVVVT